MVFNGPVSRSNASLGNLYHLIRKGLNTYQLLEEFTTFKKSTIANKVRRLLELGMITAEFVDGVRMFRAVVTPVMEKIEFRKEKESVKVAYRSMWLQQKEREAKLKERRRIRREYV